MKTCFVPLVLAALCGAGVAQVPTDAAGKAPAKAESAAAIEFKELADQHMARLRTLQRGDDDARDAALAQRKADLTAFVAKHPKTVEAAKAHLELAQVANQARDQAAAHAALAALDASLLDLTGVIRAAMTASAIGSDDRKQSFLDAAKAKAKTIDEQFELVGALRTALRDNEAADAQLAAIEKSAVTAEDKAAVLLGKAGLARRASRDDRTVYQELLGEAAREYPATRAGKIAAAKLAAAKLKVGSDPVPFSAVDMDGKEVSPADYRGKVLLIDFWATWCGPCMAELPHVLEAYEQYRDQGFEILGISLDRDVDKDKLISTIKDRGMSWRHIYDGKYWQAEVAQLHDVNSIPFTILIGKDGKVAGMNLRGNRLGEAVKAALEAH